MRQTARHSFWGKVNSPATSSIISRKGRHSSTDEAREQLNFLKTDKGLLKRYKAVKKALLLLANSPRHPGLRTHEFTSLKGPKGEKVCSSVTSSVRNLSISARDALPLSICRDKRVALALQLYQRYPAVGHFLYFRQNRSRVDFKHLCRHHADLKSYAVF